MHKKGLEEARKGAEEGRWRYEMYENKNTLKISHKNLGPRQTLHGSCVFMDVCVECACVCVWPQGVTFDYTDSHTHTSQAHSHTYKHIESNA